MDALEKQLEINQLLSYYRPLLTTKQQTIMTYYYEDNYTLAEIAEIESISRNAVHDTLKKTIVKLYDYEKKLNLKAKDDKRLALIETAQKQDEINAIKSLLDALKKVE